MFDLQTLGAWVLMPLLIFFARAFDVTLGTLRIIFITQGYKKVAPLVGFCETLIWLLIVKEALRHVSNPLCAVAYAGGFATGNVVGLKLEEKLAMGRRLLRVILPNGYEPGEESGPDLVAELRAAGFGVTVVHGEGLKGPVKVLLTLPLVFNGLGHGSGAHAPNEYMVILPAAGSAVAGLAEIEKAYVDLLYALAAR